MIRANRINVWLSLRLVFGALPPGSCRTMAAVRRRLSPRLDKTLKFAALLPEKK